MSKFTLNKCINCRLDSQQWKSVAVITLYDNNGCCLTKCGCFCCVLQSSSSCQLGHFYLLTCHYEQLQYTRAYGIKLSGLASSGVKLWVRCLEIGIYYFSAKHVVLRKKSKRVGSVHMMCPSEATCPSVDCYFSELVL